MIGDPVEILMVEDDPGDVETKESTEETKLRVNLNVVEGGVKALDYIHKRGEYSDVASPDVVLLDLNLPRKDCREVLAEIRPQWKFDSEKTEKSTLQ